MKKSRQWIRTAGWIAVILMTTAFIGATPQIASQKDYPSRKTPGSPDLAATIDYCEVKYSPLNGQWIAVVHGKISNIGDKNFEGKPGDFTVMVIAKKSWEPDYPTVVTVDGGGFVGKGISRTESAYFVLPAYTKTGCTPLIPSECCRDLQFAIKIVYNPDIRSDGNPGNDDNNAGNDSSKDTPAARVKYSISCASMK